MTQSNITLEPATEHKPASQRDTFQVGDTCAAPLAMTFEDLLGDNDSTDETADDKMANLVIV